MKLLLLISVFYATMLDTVWAVFFWFCFHCLLMAVWRYFDRPPILTLVALFLWPIMPLCANVQGGMIQVVPSVTPVSLLVAALVVWQMLHVAKDFGLLCAWLIIRPDPQWTKIEREGKAEEQNA